MIANQFLGGESQKDLAPVGGGEQPTDSIEDGAEVVAIPALGTAGMDSHPDLDGVDALPWLVEQEPLGGNGGLEGSVGYIKRNTKGVADGLEHVAAASLERLAQQGIVPGKCHGHRVAMAIPETRTALDIREEKCDSACGRCGHDEIIARGSCTTGTESIRLLLFRVSGSRAVVIHRLFLSLLLVFALCTPSFGRLPKATKKREVVHHHTVIESVDSSSITVQTTNEKVPVEKTYKITGDTEITFDGQRAAPNQLKAGQRVDITPDGADETVAGQIAASDPPPADSPTPKPKK